MASSGLRIETPCAIRGSRPQPTPAGASPDILSCRFSPLIKTRLPDPLPCPQSWLRHLQRIPRRIAEIDRARAVRPVKIRLDFHPRRVQPGAPVVKRRAIDRETEMPRPLRAMWRHRHGRVARRLAGLGWVEDQQHTAADAVKHVL